MNVFPDFFADFGHWRPATGRWALLTIVLITAVAVLIISAIIWAISQASGNYRVASKSRVGVLVALGAAALAGRRGGAHELADQHRTDSLNTVAAAVVPVLPGWRGGRRCLLGVGVYLLGE